MICIIRIVDLNGKKFRLHFWEAIAPIVVRYVNGGNAAKKF